ncbi:MAG: hypothetical protein MUF27_14670 [Acidobacteria bacterium]|jgi:uncharacterized protein YidB (DUF937 family)|nr:hypothetical protein [Acidobacteriota bacterium]
MSSWIGGGPNKLVEPSALAGILGNDTLGQFAKMAGIDASQAGSMPGARITRFRKAVIR